MARSNRLTLRISDETRQFVEEIAQEDHLSITSVISQLIAVEYRRRRMRETLPVVQRRYMGE